MRYLLATSTIITGLVYISPALSQTCNTAPSCIDMGYIQTEDDCKGKISIRCPYDLSAYLCS